jgi:adenine phosphoribosyltransferase
VFEQQRLAVDYPCLLFRYCSVWSLKFRQEEKNSIVIIMSSSNAAVVAAEIATAAAAPVEEEDEIYAQDGPAAREIAQYLPYFPFKGIPRFYDIGGFLNEPIIFQKIVDIFTSRYRALSIDIVAGLDARGFVLGPPIALALRKPFVMMRKAGKMPNTITSNDYQCEYGNRSGLTVQRDKIKPHDRVLIIDDLVATGGTLGSAISLVKMLGGTVVECACVVELKLFIDPSPDTGLPNRTQLMTQLGHDDVPVWGLVSEDVLTNEASLPTDYVDDGEEH